MEACTIDKIPLMDKSLSPIEISCLDWYNIKYKPLPYAFIWHRNGDTLVMLNYLTR
jgi:hypothetical protein